MKRRLIWAAALAAIVLSGCGSDTLKPLDGWGTDLKKAKAQAKAGDKPKPLAVLYSASWSDVARKFEKTALKDAKVKAELDRFVRVRLDLDDKGKKGKGVEKKNEYGIEWAPSLVLISPQGEVKKLEKGGYPAAYLARELKKLGEWKSLEGWESDRATAEKKAVTSRKRLAVLYSAAWTEDAVKYEEEGLAGARKALAAEFTLLRLNLAANRKEAKALKIETAPTLVLSDNKGRKLVVSGKHSAELLTTFVKGLAGYQKVAGWRSDYETARKEAKEEKQPLVVVLDKPVDWNSHQFVRKVLGTGEIAALLKSFVKVRLEYDPKSKLAVERKVRRADLPCVLIFYKDGEYRETRTFKDSAKEILIRLHQVRGQQKTPKKAKAGG